MALNFYTCTCTHILLRTLSFRSLDGESLIRNTYSRCTNGCWISSHRIINQSDAVYISSDNFGRCRTSTVSSWGVNIKQCGRGDFRLAGGAAQRSAVPARCSPYACIECHLPHALRIANKFHQLLGLLSVLHKNNHLISTKFGAENVFGNTCDQRSVDTDVEMQSGGMGGSCQVASSRSDRYVDGHSIVDTKSQLKLSPIYLLPRRRPLPSS